MRNKQYITGIETSHVAGQYTGETVIVIHSEHDTEADAWEKKRTSHLRDLRVYHSTAGEVQELRKEPQ